MDVQRPYTEKHVERLRGSQAIEHALARRGAERLRERLARDEPLRALGASTGHQAVQQVKAGLEAIYLSGWQVAADANLAGADTPTRACTRPTASRPWCPASTTRYSGPTRFTMPRATMTSTGSSPSWPTPRPGSEGRSTASS